ncbi:MAG: hypothetical protein ACRETZ_05505, partial [Steroidobacteraceae bacterium]
AVARNTFFACSSAEGLAPIFRRSPQQGLFFASKTGLILESASAINRVLEVDLAGEDVVFTFYELASPS